jgi:hypothetical protein
MGTTYNKDKSKADPSLALEDNSKRNLFMLVILSGCEESALPVSLCG